VGLDATVYCECYEKGRLNHLPPKPDLLYVDLTGQVVIRLEAPGADIFAFDQWRAHACEHPNGGFVSCRLGNIAVVGFVREALGDTPNLFPILLSKVLYDGAHTGDFLTPDLVRILRAELDRFSRLHRNAAQEEKLLRSFELQMRRLVEASLALDKPIVF
jgi:hypothetical protein